VLSLGKKFQLNYFILTAAAAAAVGKQEPQDMKFEY